MEIIIGIGIYLIVISALLAFGQFLKECDDTIQNQFIIEKQNENKTIL